MVSVSCLYLCQREHFEFLTPYLTFELAILHDLRLDRESSDEEMEGLFDLQPRDLRPPEVWGGTAIEGFGSSFASGISFIGNIFKVEVGP